MPVFPAVYSLVQDPNDPSGQTYQLVVNIDPQYIPNLSAELDVDNGLAGASQQYLAFTGTADLGVATAGVYSMFLSLVGGGTSAATIVISGVPGSLTVVVATPAATTAAAFGFDTDTPMTSANMITALTSTSNYVFCLRYVAHVTTTTYPADISPSEVGLLLQNNVALMLVQHPPKANWSPNAALGTSHGSAAVTNAGKASVAKGVTIFCDLEGVIASAAVSDVTDYCNNWAATVSGAGYVPGLYVGANCGLNDAQLSALNFTLYWESCSVVPSPAQGFNMSQGPCDVMRGNAAVTVKVDEDTISASPGSLTWLMTQAPVATFQQPNAKKRRKPALSATRTPVVRRAIERR